MKRTAFNDMSREQMAELARAIYGMPLEKTDGYQAPNKFTADK